MIIKIPDYDEMEREFLFHIGESEIHDEIIEQFKIYVTENEKWCKKANFEASIRARNALLAMFKLCKSRRAEITEERKDLGLI
jgi:hypothetical protein